VSWHEFACRIAEEAGFDADLVAPDDGPREAATVLSSRHGMHLRPLEDAIADFARAVAPLIEPEEQIAAE
jgi:hypothetical protein